MKQQSLADIKRLFASNIGREIIGIWPQFKIYGNIGDTIIHRKTEKRTIMNYM
jgi:hypothetical protein